MEYRKKIADLIEHKLSYTNGWRVDDETYENECLMVADEIIKLFSIPVVVGRSEQYCDWCSSTEDVEVKICKKCRQGMDSHR